MGSWCCSIFVWCCCAWRWFDYFVLIARFVLPRIVITLLGEVGAGCYAARLLKWLRFVVLRFPTLPLFAREGLRFWIVALPWDLSIVFLPVTYEVILKIYFTSYVHNLCWCSSSDYWCFIFDRTKQSTKTVWNSVAYTKQYKISHTSKFNFSFRFNAKTYVTLSIFEPPLDKIQEAGILIDSFDTTTIRYKMATGPDKKKVMTNSTNGFQREIKIKGQRLEAVENFKCLGAIRSKPEILSRIAQTATALSRLKVIWRDRNISLTSKVKLMLTLILSTFLYVYESWTWQQKSREGSKTLRWDARGDVCTFPTKIMWQTRRFATESRMQLECMMIT